MIYLVVAHDVNRVIGKDNKMPWHYPEDLKYFKSVTLNKNVLMGSNTLGSIISYLGKPLPNRHTILLTSRKEVSYDVEIVNSIEDALDKYKNKDLFIVGGKSVYEQFLPYADYLYITLINKEYDGDTYFPEYDLNEWELLSNDNQDVLEFKIYKRVKKWFIFILH